MIVVAIASAAMLSCRHEGHEAEHHHHDAEHYTVYSDKYELFMEAGELAPGEKATLRAHITRLSDFKPLDSCGATLRLTVGGAVAEQRLDNPGEPGIYCFEVTPTKAGCGRMEVLVDAAGGMDTLTVGHVHVEEEDEDDHGHHHHHHGHEGHGEGRDHHHHEHAAEVANSVAFTKEQSWKIDFATEEMQPSRFGRVIKTTAQVLTSQGDESQVSAKTSGIVTFVNDVMVEGTAVHAGQRLFTIESRGLSDNNMGVRYQEAAANYERAKAEYERKQRLGEERIVSRNDVERSRAEYESAKAVYDNLKGNFSPNGAVVTSPLSGYVKGLYVKNGAYVEAGSPVVAVSRNSDLLVRAEVSPRYYADLSRIESATLVLPGGDVRGMGDLKGTLVGYGHATSTESPLVPVTFRFRNTLGLVPGSFVTLYIRTKSDDMALAVPNGGIVEEMGNTFVFVQITPELFEKRLVQLGATDGERTVIVSGVKAGERLVTKGAAMVKLAQGAGALDPHAGHVH